MAKQLLGRPVAEALDQKSSQTVQELKAVPELQQ